jgi:arylsulfatase A-like enzyme/thioredoxin-like negative regulator of GroEL
MLLAFSFLGTVGCAAENAHQPDVLIVTWDTVRADHVGLDHTPVWNALAERAAVFTHARTPVPITLPAHASIMTGVNPPNHGARDNGTWPINDALPTLAERFRDAGWSTGAFVSASVLDSRYGIARGFSTYNDHITPGKNRVVAHRPGSQTVDHALDWLADKDDEQPIFLWVHLFDPHRPWADSDQQGQTPYEAAIGIADAATQRLLDGIEARGRTESSIVVLTSDHGEGLGDHGEDTHGFFAYDSTVRVPLMVFTGGAIKTGATKGVEVNGPASLLDIAPTLLEAADLDPFPSDGISLLPHLNGEPIGARTLSVETVTPALDFDAAPVFAVFDHNKRAWYDLPTPERYHLDSDPKQLVNRYRPDHAAVADAAFQKFPRRWPPTTDPMALSEQDREALESLGYITRSEAPKDVSKVDPKDRVDLFNLLTQTPDDNAAALLERADAMVEKHGPVPALMLFKADLLDVLARPLDALQTVRMAAETHPTDRDLNGEYLKRSRKLKELEQLATAINAELRDNPKNLVARRDLALTLHRLQRFSEAEALYRVILADNPGNDETRVELARILASQARYDAAIGTLAPALRRPGHAPIVDCMAGRLMSRGMNRSAEAQALLAKCEQ